MEGATLSHKRLSEIKPWFSYQIFFTNMFTNNNTDNKENWTYQVRKAIVLLGKNWIYDYKKIKIKITV